MTGAPQRGFAGLHEMHAGPRFVGPYKKALASPIAVIALFAKHRRFYLVLRHGVRDPEDHDWLQQHSPSFGRLQLLRWRVLARAARADEGQDFVVAEFVACRKRHVRDLAQFTRSGRG